MSQALDQANSQANSQANTAGAALAQRLQILEDREAIREAMFAYCRGIDRGDEAQLRSAYWPDATDRHGAYQGSATGFIEHALPKLGKGRYVHNVANLSIQLNGDSAAVESYFLAYQADEGKDGQWQSTFLCGRYVDRFEARATAQSAREWRIAARVVAYDWQELYAHPTGTEAERFGLRQPIGSAKPSDPWYALLEQVFGPAAQAPAGTAKP